MDAPFIWAAVSHKTSNLAKLYVLTVRLTLSVHLHLASPNRNKVCLQHSTHSV